MLTGQDFLAKKLFHLKQEKKVKFIKFCQFLNKNQALLIKMDTVHNIIIDPFEIVQKGKVKL